MLEILKRFSGLFTIDVHIGYPWGDECDCNASGTKN
jgi:hypothetical protein